MRHERQLALLKQCLQYTDEKSTQMAAEEYLAPVEQYTDLTWFEKEKKGLIQRYPTMIVHISELPESNTFVRREFGGMSLLVTRDKEDEYHVFLNVCRHRGAALVSEEKGCAKRFTCPYHAWTYANDGKLQGVPHGKKGFPTLKREELGLVELESEVALGFVWTRLVPPSADATPQPFALREFLGAFYEDLEHFALDEHEILFEEHSRWRANWKILAEGGLETYHLQEAHKKTIAPLFLDTVSMHHQINIHQRSILPKRSLLTLPSQEESTWSIREHANVLFSLLPFSSLLVQPDHITWILMVPVSPEETQTSIYTLIPKKEGERSEKEFRYWQKNHELLVVTLTEDFDLAESIHKGFHSGANTHLRFARFEGALQTLHKIIHEAVEAV